MKEDLKHYSIPPLFISIHVHIHPRLFYKAYMYTYIVGKLTHTLGVNLMLLLRYDVKSHATQRVITE